jgi:hypothetical protein
MLYISIMPQSFSFALFIYLFIWVKSEILLEAGLDSPFCASHTAGIVIMYHHALLTG